MTNLYISLPAPGTLPVAAAAGGGAGGDGRGSPACASRAFPAASCGVWQIAVGEGREEKGKGKNEWKRLSVHRNSYNQTLLACQGLPVPGFTGKVWGSCCNFRHRDFASLKCR